MKLGIIKTINLEEISKASKEPLPEWVKPMLESINQFIEQAGKALQGNLTFQDNFLSRQKKLTFSDSVEKVLNPEAGPNLRVMGVIPLSSELFVDGFAWSHKSDGSIGVTFNFTGGTDAVCEVLILLR